MTIHTLEKERHKDFLAQNRIDPITGDILQEGDQVVICASCKSAFLVDSWEYMDKKHCNQRITLKEIPIQEIVRLEKPHISFNANLEVKPISISKAAQIASGNLNFPASILFILLYFKTDIAPYILSTITFLFIFFSWFFFWVINDYKNYLYIKGKFLSFKKEEKWDDKILLSSVKNIRCYKPSRYWLNNLFRKNSKKFYTLEFTVDYNIKHKILITQSTLDRIKNETPLLKMFSTNPLPHPSVHVEIEQHTV